MTMIAVAVAGCTLPDCVTHNHVGSAKRTTELAVGRMDRQMNRCPNKHTETRQWSDKDGDRHTRARGERDGA